MTPRKCSPIAMMIAAAIQRRMSKYSRTIWPNAVAAAPSPMKIVITPAANMQAASTARRRTALSTGASADIWFMPTPAR